MDVVNCRVSKIGFPSVDSKFTLFVNPDDLTWIIVKQLITNIGKDDKMLISAQCAKHAVITNNWTFKYWQKGQYIMTKIQISPRAINMRVNQTETNLKMNHLLYH